MALDPRASWTNPKVIMTLLLVFLCGSLTGALAMRYGLSVGVLRPVSYWSEGGREISLQRFEQELSLTPAQAKEMELILDDFTMYYHTLQAQMDDVRASGKGRILQVLSDEQRRKFEGMVSELYLKPIK